MTNDEYISEIALSGELGLPQAWIKAEASAGRIPVLQVGRRRLYHLESVRRSLMQREARPSPNGPVYLASPYTHPDPAVRQARFEAACQATARMILDGTPVFCPVVHSHPLTRYGLPGDWEFWQRYDRAYLEACTGVAVLMLDGWEESKGVQAEIAAARQMGKPVIFIDPEEAA